MADALPNRLDVMDGLLDTAHPPVARFRIMSTGLAPNHTLDSSNDIAGSEACLACGSCVDACPVVASKLEGTMFVRTSMLLEHVVAGSCRRCFRCVAACPQVTGELKDYARSFRAVERASHWLVLVSYLSLMTTGMLIHHWAQQLPSDLHRLLGGLHRACGVGLLLAPVLFFALDRHHWVMAIRRSLSWSADDGAWFRNAWRWLASAGKRGEVQRGAFNPGQRIWYLYVPLAIATFAITGAIKWMGPQIAGKGIVSAATAVHVAVAIVTDVLVLVHVWLKLGWPVVRGAARRTRLVLAYRQLRARLAGEVSAST
jgi:cytochrome b subunit of formate dehydrogenase